MRRPLPVLLAVLTALLTACAVSEGGTGTDAATSGSTASSSSDTVTTTGEVSTTSVPTTGESSSTADTADSSSSSDGTTGEPAWCYGWEGAAGAPYLDLFGLDEALLVDGGEIQLQCGPQGSFMFGLYPSFGGFTPPGDQISFDVVVDVEGHNTNPEGHFYSVTDSGYYVGCEQIIGGVLGVVPVIPGDNEDVLTLDGLLADFHVVLHTADGDITLDMKLTLLAKDDGSWEFCSQG